MARLLLEYLAICENKNLPKTQKIYLSKFKILPNYKRTLSKWPKYFNIMPMGPNFAESGHTEGNVQQHRLK